MKKAEREALKIRRLKEMKAFDGQFAEAGRGFVCGVDEVGRGPLAGPVLAAAVVLPDGFDIPGIDDSKKLSDKKRREFNDIILERATAYGFGIRDNSVIDEINILNAAKEAMYDAVREAADMLQTRRGSEPGFVLFDAVSLENFPYPQMAIVKGDQKSLSIAAASIIAKVRRDDLMIKYAEDYPGYGFERNKGYGTKAHYEGIRQYGITPIHRKSFLKNFFEKSK